MAVKAVKAAAARVQSDKCFAMKNYNRDLLLLYKTEAFNEDLLHHEVECLHHILLQIESNEAFCRAHELATRSKITNRAKAILRSVQYPVLKPFHFLINKN